MSSVVLSRSSRELSSVYHLLSPSPTGDRKPKRQRPMHRPHEILYCNNVKRRTELKQSENQLRYWCFDGQGSNIDD